MPEQENQERLRAAIEATRLGFGLSSGAVREFTRSAAQLHVRGLCLPPLFLGEAAAMVNSLPDWQPELVTVANFPTGDHGLSLVLLEVEAALRSGAQQIDLVVPSGLVAERRWREVTDFIRNSRLHAEAIAGHPIAFKVILESAAWDEERIRGAADSAIEAGARWLKSSTGFHPAGGATPERIELLRRLAPPQVGIKASGGIRTRTQALAMLSAGADRIGTSAEEAILQHPASGPGRS